MTSPIPEASPSDLHRAATDAVMADLVRADHRAVIVDSPPGAGKSTFVVQAARDLSEYGPVPIVSQTNAQANDLVDKVLTSTDLVVGRLFGGTPPAD